jgi:hypothetical protein
MTHVVPSAAAVARARECLKIHSRSYVQDAEYFAAIIVAIADGRADVNGVERAPIERAQPAEPEVKP